MKVFSFTFRNVLMKIYESYVIHMIDKSLQQATQFEHTANIVIRNKVRTIFYYKTSEIIFIAKFVRPLTH